MSAGGASTHFHMLNSKSRGLFHKAISMSGCILNPWVIMEKPLNRTKELASIVGCPSENVQAMLKCLRETPADQIVSVVGDFQPWLFNPFSPFGAVIDSWSKDPVLPRHPLELLEKGDLYDIPWISSHTTGEGLYPGFDFYPEKYLKHINDHWDDVVPHILHYDFTVAPSLRKEVNSKIRSEYFGNGPVDRQSYKKLIDMIGDRLFKVDIEKCTRLQAAAMKSPAFHYIFDYRGVHSWTELRSGTKENIGVSHADDSIYVFKTSLDSLSTKSDRHVSKIMVDIFTSFAKTGLPKIDIEWPEISKNKENPMKYLEITSDVQVGESKELGNNKFWDSLPFSENYMLRYKDEL
ncbi:hypothetical protein WA026_005238 [Henosepilachna vigintioctopunctata]|uniref:Carboxylesterase type B domain-containing protein n=1 Tax=Henosepilachna vigintioctopunctata TaxID=420089 RepID=A0AAW1UU35_9CUCU